jgi:hypothetical protein
MVLAGKGGPDLCCPAVAWRPLSLAGGSFGENENVLAIIGIQKGINI